MALSAVRGGLPRASTRVERIVVERAGVSRMVTTVSHDRAGIV
jgi:hypothetical protein